jgi:hypothetical protein
MSTKSNGDIIITQTNVPTNRNKAYISLVDVDSFIAGKKEQQHRTDEPHIIHFSLLFQNFYTIEL